MGPCLSCICGDDDIPPASHVSRKKSGLTYVPPAEMQKSYDEPAEGPVTTNQEQILDHGNLRAWVTPPPEENVEAWIAKCLHDIFGDISLLCDMSMEGWLTNGRGERGGAAGEGFPPGFEYRWVDGERHPEPMRVSAVEYVVLVMAWAEAQTEQLLFAAQEEGGGRQLAALPRSSGRRKLRPRLKAVFKRLFRVLAILSHALKPFFAALGAVPHLNAVTKHFLFICFEFQLVNEREFDALRDSVDIFKRQYGSLFDSVNRTLFDKTVFVSQVAGGAVPRPPPQRSEQ